MKSIAVHCGAPLDAEPGYADEHNIELVYGDTKVGLMGAIADEVLRLRRRSHRRDPQGPLVELEVGHADRIRLFVVKEMHE